MGIDAVTVVGLVGGLIFLFLWFIGVFFWFKELINGIGLVRYTRKKYPDIRVSFFVFIHKSDSVINHFPGGLVLLLKLVLSFGSKRATEEWTAQFMDLDALRKTNDPKINYYVKNVLMSSSVFVKALVAMALDWIVTVAILQLLGAGF